MTCGLSIRVAFGPPCGALDPPTFRQFLWASILVSSGLITSTKDSQI
jgi:hypothetical protein